MTPDEADEILVMFEAGWPESRWSEDRREIWREQLAPLNAAAIGVAFTQLMRSSTRCPSFAELCVAADPAARHPSTQPARPCGYCDGTGWVNCTDDRRHGPDCQRSGDCLCSASVPCTACPRGRMIAKRLQEAG